MKRILTKSAILKLAIVILTVSLFSCNKDTSTGGNGGGKLKFEITLSPVPRTGNSNDYGWAMFNGGTFVTEVELDGTSSSSVKSSDIVNATAGQNISVLFGANRSDNQCTSLTIKAILNGKIIDSRTFSLGSGKTPACKDEGIGIGTYTIALP